MKLTCEVQGRYVIYYNTRRGNEHKKTGFSSMAYVELCEVQVIGKNQNKKNQNKNICNFVLQGYLLYMYNFNVVYIIL